MGCHTWFYRPVTKEELELFREHALEDAWKLWGETERNKEFGLVRIDRYNAVKESLEKNTDYWWKNGYGTRLVDENGVEREESVAVIQGKLYLDLAASVSPIFENIERYHDVFRVYNYPLKKIHSRKELRKFLGKRYFELEDWQLEKVSEFFRNNKGGVITFG